MSSSDELKQQLKSLADVRRESLEAVLTKLVETGAVSAEKVNSLVEQIRETTGKKIKAARKVKLSVEQAELLEELEAQYPTMQATLKRYEISTQGIPTWEQIKKGLTSDVIDKTLKLGEPTLLLVPPTTRQSKVEAINNHPVKGQKHDTYTHELNSNNLWNKGKSKPENKWRVSIVDGVQDVETDPEIIRGTNYEMSKAWVKKYKDQGLDVMDNADAYLTLVMKGLAEDKPVDSKTCTVLNGKNLTEHSHIAYGSWGDDQGWLSVINPDSSGGTRLRLRASVEIDVQS